MRIAIVADSSSGIKPTDIEDKDIFLLPMPFSVNGEEHFEDVSITQPDFYELLTNDDTKVSTSQPSTYSVEELWTNILKEYDHVIHIPLSSNLSDGCKAAMNLAEQSFKGKATVIDNQRVSVTLKESIYEAEKMVKDGKSVEEIVAHLNDTKLNSSIYIALATLKYLKKGGRITPAAAAIGEVLKLKPILQIQGGKLDAYKKVLSKTMPKGELLKAADKDIKGRFADAYEAGKLKGAIVYTDNLKEALAFKEEVQAKFPKLKIEFVDPLSLIVSCHIGGGTMAIALFESIKD